MGGLLPHLAPEQAVSDDESDDCMNQERGTGATPPPADAPTSLLPDRLLAIHR